MTQPALDKPRGLKRWSVALATIFALGLTLTVLSTGRVVQFGPMFELSDRLADVPIERSEDGSYTVVFDEQSPDGQMSPEAFVEALYQKQKAQNQRGFMYRLFDITSWTGLLWVGFGLGGQAMFTGRMLVQWLASEKRKRSVVPVAFWWMSLTGATMLMMYFIWRVEIVGLLGQSTGWFIYVRNLWLIYRPHPDAETGGISKPKVSDDPAPEPARDER